MIQVILEIKVILKKIGAQKYLVFQPMYRYFEKIGNTERISSWTSRGLSDKIIKPPNTSDNSLAPALSYIGINTRAKFDRGCLKQDKITFTPGTILNIYSVYEISFSDSNNNYPTFKNCLLGAVKLTTNADIYKCTNILDMVLGLTNVEPFYFLLVDLVTM